MEPQEQFIRALWPDGLDDGECLSISFERITPDGKRKLVTIHADDVHPYTDFDIPEQANTWINLGTRRAGLESWQRGEKADVARVPGLHLDLDVASAAHKDGSPVYATFEAAWGGLHVIEELVGPATVVVHSGHGLQAYWLFDEPMGAHDPATTDLFDAWQRTLARVTGGLADVGANDIARMQRLPGTLNVKIPDAPKPVTIARHDHLADRYNGVELIARLDPPPAFEVPRGERKAPIGGLLSPGDDYSAQMGTAEVTELLVAHGAKVTHTATHEGRQVAYLARPGKDPRDGHSMSVGYAVDGGLTVWSSGWAELPPGHYDPFGVKARLEFDGDFPACARELATEGFGNRVIPLDVTPDATDADLGEVFAAECSEIALHSPGIGWFLWDGRRWVERTEDAMLGIVERLVIRRAILSAQRDYVKLQNDGAPDDKLKAAMALYRAHKGYLSVVRRAHVLRDAAWRLSVDASELDAEPDLLNVENGVVDLATKELMAHDPKRLMTKMARADYRPGAQTPDWTKALDAQPDPDQRAYLQGLFGVATTGRVSDTLAVLIGSGSNGKSAITGAVLHALGDYGVPIDVDVLTGATGGPQRLMPLRGARFALASESAEDHYLAAERIKMLTGGDRLMDRNLYATSYAEWAPTHTVVLATNHRPRLRSTEHAMQRRLRLIPFEVTFQGEQVDAGLRDRLTGDADNRAAILSWLVDGAHEWLKAGRKLPEAPGVELATAEWMGDEDTVTNFFREEEFAVSGLITDTVGGATMYRRYRRWALDSGHRPKSNQALATEMITYAHRLKDQGEQTFERARVRAGTQWMGIRDEAPWRTHREDGVQLPPDERHLGDDLNDDFPF